MTSNNHLYQCRLCLKRTPTKINVFGGDFPKMLEILTNIKVRENDGLPKYSCTKCAQDVKSALITKKRIIKSHKALIEHLKRKKEQQVEHPTILIVENDDEPEMPLVVHSNMKSSIRKEQPSIDHVRNIEFVAVDSSPTLSQTLIEVEKNIKKECEEINKLNSKVPIKDKEGLKVDTSLQKVLNHLVDKTPGKDQFHCGICDLTFTFRSEFNLHRSKHRKTKCQICGAIIRTDNFKKHLMLHDAAPMNCKLCGATCKNIESLRGHIYYQHKMQADTYVCEECGKKFRTKYKFSLHKRKEHTGLRAFKCETCGKGFFTKGNLMTHDRMTHKKLRPHICEFCGTGFSSPYALKTHKRQHTDEKPYVCEFCKEGFRQKVSLRSHLKSKHGFEEPKEAICQQCGKGFANAYALNIHERLHVNTEKCDLCSDSFAEREYLKNHLKLVHSAEMEIIELEEVKLQDVCD